MQVGFVYVKYYIWCNFVEQSIVLRWMFQSRYIKIPIYAILWFQTLANDL